MSEITVAFSEVISFLNNGGVWGIATAIIIAASFVVLFGDNSDRQRRRAVRVTKEHSRADGPGMRKMPFEF